MNREIREEIYRKVKEVYESDEAKKIRAEYRDETLYELGESEHKRLIGDAVMATYWVMYNGGTSEEIKKMILWTLVCIDSRQKRLDYHHFNHDYEISEIFNKYGKGVSKAEFYEGI